MPGTFSYSPAAGTILGAGVQTLTATFTPVAGTGSSPVTATAVIPVLRAAPTMVVSDGGGLYNGSPFAAAVTIAGIDGTAGPSLEGISPALTYYAGTSATGTPLSGPPAGAGTYTAIAAFPGSVNYAPTQSAPVTFTIAPVGTTVWLATSSASAVVGQPVTLTANAAAADPGAGTPSGPVTFYDGPETLAAVPLDASGRAIWTGSLGMGDHALMVSYGGNADFRAARSDAVSWSVAPAQTHVLLVPRPVVKGGKIPALILSVGVEPLSPGDGVPTGSVTLRTRRILGTVALSDGRASLTVRTRSVLNRPVVVIYGGGAGYRSSTLVSPRLTPASLVHLARASLKKPIDRPADHHRSHLAAARK